MSHQNPASYSAFPLVREAEGIAFRQGQLQRAQRTPTPPLEEEDVDETHEPNQSDQDSVVSSPVSTSSIKSFFSRTLTKPKENTSPKPSPWREPQACLHFLSISYVLTVPPAL
ncbi:hypothetical protein AX17_001372 [Amanita inopinata Kibby_2008]|nr:hypothetical protein AX17_001372 [Amanita inopinata Kibby_2008]